MEYRKSHRGRTYYHRRSFISLSLVHTKGMAISVVPFSLSWVGVFLCSTCCLLYLWFWFKVVLVVFIVILF